MSSTGVATFNPYDQKTLECVAWNILLCPTHERAQRDHSELPDEQQKQVWNDLTGSEAKKKHVIMARRDGKGRVRMIVNDEIEESPLFLHECLIRLELELHQIEHKPAYNLAVQQAPRYVHDLKFRIKFLRTEKFDCQSAAKRMVLHFEMKLELFGRECLGRDILLQDLNEDDLHSLKMGYMQILPALDHGNRKVIFYYKAVTGCYRRRENFLKASWYMYNKLSEDEAVQKLGVVNVVYNIGGFPDGGMDYEKSRRFSNQFKAIPIRFDSFFVALDIKAWLIVVETFSVMVSKFVRVRMRALQGSHIEALYGLVSLGIPCHCLPVNDRSELLIENHLAWIEEQDAIERGGGSTNNVLLNHPRQFQQLPLVQIPEQQQPMLIVDD